jgi:hypothetical protein
MISVMRYATCPQPAPHKSKIVNPSKKGQAERVISIANQYNTLIDYIKANARDSGIEEIGLRDANQRYAFGA